MPFSVSIESSSLQGGDYQAMIKSANQGVWTSVDVLLQSPTPKQADTVSFRRAYGSEDQSETVEGKERFVIAEMDPNRYVPLPEMMVDFDDAACRISCRAHMEREF